eukprot:CAMPEP_0179944302 /NCGR_PEP_ID=MMETSP0983-20121128/18911_1 /TAXON_ID=483367 /ORGANISM="non described non described, Strain CCMP 2436" /LENGTH=911 /DNA_ID=CAMNT_0021852329 /DNA_START=66 /DNA_END=2801 /DNA_ORIENTATION=+
MAQTVRERMTQYESRQSIGGELGSARLACQSSVDFTRRVSMLEVPLKRALSHAQISAAEAVTPPAHGAPAHPRGVFLPLHVHTPENSPVRPGANKANTDASPRPKSALGSKLQWRVSSGLSPKTPSRQPVLLADAALSYELRAAFRSCEVNAEGTIPVRELGFGLGCVHAPIASAEPEEVLLAAGFLNATRLSLSDFGACARELVRLRAATATLSGAVPQRLGFGGAARFSVAATRLAQTDENSDPAAISNGGLRSSRPSLCTVPGVGAKPTKELSGQLLRVHGAYGLHSFSHEEKAAFANYLSFALADDADLAHAQLLPISSENLELFEKVRDGVILCKLVNLAQADAIDERAINTARRLALRVGSSATSLSLFQTTENHNLAISAARAVGCHVINIGASDLMEGTPHLLLGLVWQLVKMALLSSVNLQVHPGLAVLLKAGEELPALSALPAEHVLLRWLNWHLEQAGFNQRVKNFGKDLADSLAYTVLLHRIAPASIGASLAPLTEPNVLLRAQTVVKTAARLGDVAFSIGAADIAQGNEKLNLGFIAALFNAAPGLELLSAEEAVRLETMAAERLALEASELARAMAGASSMAERERILNESREERAFRMWLNSLSLERFVTSLFVQVTDGFVLLQAMDKLQPGLVDWKGRVNRRPRTVYEQVENNNYAILLATSPLTAFDKGGATARMSNIGGAADALAGAAGFGLSLVGVGGKDLYDGNRTYILAVIWQLMRFHLLNFIQLAFDRQRLAQSLSPPGRRSPDSSSGLLSPGGRAVRAAARRFTGLKKGAPMGEEDVLRWANEAVARTGSKRKIESFRERSVCTGRFLLELLAAVEPRSVDAALVQPIEWDLIRGADPEACALNAKYAISCARKMGCSVFCLWEDVVEVRPKLVFAFVAALMARQLEL